MATIPKAIKAVAASDTESRGGAVRPIYGVRTPVVYQLFETEMHSISAFNGQAFVWLSLGELLLLNAIAILIDYAFATGPTSELGHLMLHGIAPISGALAAACFSGAIYVIWRKRNLIDQIKLETKSDESSFCL